MLTRVWSTLHFGLESIDQRDSRTRITDDTDGDGNAAGTSLRGPVIVSIGNMERARRRWISNDTFLPLRRRDPFLTFRQGNHQSSPPSFPRFDRLLIALTLCLITFLLKSNCCCCIAGDSLHPEDMEVGNRRPDARRERLLSSEARRFHWSRYSSELRSRRGPGKRLNYPYI